jgi:hypothetical protein
MKSPKQVTNNWSRRTQDREPSGLGILRRAASNRTQLVNVIQSINTYLGFFLRPEGQWSGLSSKGSYRVRLHHQKPCNRRVTHAVGGCKSVKVCHAFHRAVVHRVPNNPLFVLLPDFVSHLDSTFSANSMMVRMRRFAAAWQPSSGVGKS